MALAPSEERAFTEDDPAPIEEVLAELTNAARGWVNFVPEVEPGHQPPPRGMVIAVFSSRGDPVPLATWSAPDAPGQRATVGIEHGSGPKALDRLREHHLGLDPGWLRVSDHPRRGLVATTPPDARVSDVLWWLLASSHALSTVPLTGAWLSTIYRDT
ncbi:hypothetical protein BH23ACT2_BH23ACT2_14580 [soil metagenome]